MSERIVLMFAYHFPPENAVGGRRPFRFARYLPEMGYRCHVITAADQSSCPESPAEYVPDPFTCEPGRGLGWHVERVIRRFFLPAVVGIRWSLRACEAARNFARANPNAEITVFSTFPPFGTHLAAWQFSRASGMKWIADFRDPMKMTEWVEGFSGFHRALSGWLERFFLRRADLVIANTDAMAEEWRVADPGRSSRIQLIWNGFDPEERIEPLPVPSRDYKLYSHVGELYSGRNITPLLESISRLIESGRLAAAHFRIRLLGNVDRHSMPPEAFLQRARSQGWLEILPDEVPRLEAQHVMQTSDGLLLVQPQSAIQVPGKLFDYVQIGRPVLAYVPTDTPIERVLSQSGIPYRCAYSNSSPQDMDTAVESFFSLPTDYTPMTDSFHRDFDSRMQTAKLVSLIDSIRSTNSGVKRRMPGG
jgi:hypothetical protein